MSTLYSVDVSNSGDIQQPFISGNRHGSLQRFRHFLKQLSSGSLSTGTGTTSLTVRSAAATSTGTITLASCAAGTVIEVNGVEFVAISGTATAANNEFDIAGSDTTDATKLAAAINACTDARIANVLTATSALGVVTVVSTVPGYQANAVTIKTKGVCANGTVTCATVVAADTVTLNGTALTATQFRATGTITLATAVAGNTVTVNGITFTGAAGAVTLGAATFSIDTSDTAAAVSLAAQINAYTSGLIAGTLTATSALGVVTLRAVAVGTGGNAITLTKVGSPISVSGATLSGGAAIANNQFECTGTDTQVAADLVRAIGASSTALISSHFNARNVAGVVGLYAKYPGTAGNQCTTASSSGSTLAVSPGARLTGGTEASNGGAQATAVITFASCAAADTITVGGVVFTAHATVEAANQFEVSGSDTADAASFTKMFNNSVTALAQDVRASSSAAVVTLTALRGGISGNAITVATSTGVRLAITGSATRLTSGAVPITVALSGDRLASGAETRLTFSY